MEPIPLPSRIHYELLLQLLEQQTLFSVGQNDAHRRQVQDLIGTLRKALMQQKRIEETCERQNIPVEYRWSLNEALPEKMQTPNTRPPSNPQSA